MDKLPEHIDGVRFLMHLQKALGRIKRFQARYLVEALVLDTLKGDLTGSWSLRGDDFQEAGPLISTLKLPTLIVQEGGYKTKVFGANTRRFFVGLWSGVFCKGLNKNHAK